MEIQPSHNNPMENHTNPIVLLLQGIPAFLTLLSGWFSTVRPEVVNPYITMVVGCLAAIYYFKMITKKEKIDKKS